MSQRILVADDDPAVRELVRQTLLLEGFQVDAVADGPSALQAARAARPDAAVLDVMMPGTDGVSVLRSLREEPATADLPVILLTAKVDDISTWEGWRAGCNSYMPKPFDPFDLAEAVRDLLRGAA
jgi:DNA-binding response OmpR family regulator